MNPRLVLDVVLEVWVMGRLMKESERRSCFKRAVVWHAFSRVKQSSLFVSDTLSLCPALRKPKMCEEGKLAAALSLTEGALERSRSCRY